VQECTGSFQARQVLENWSVAKSQISLDATEKVHGGTFSATC